MSWYNKKELVHIANLEETIEMLQEEVKAYKEYIKPEFKKGDILKTFLHDIHPIIYEVLDDPKITYISCLDHTLYGVQITYNVYNWTNMKEVVGICLDMSANVKKIGIKIY